MRPSTRTGFAVGSDRPYVGHYAFTAREAGKFFGRTFESAELVRLWQGSRVTVLYGPSGVGKTSLLGAGAYPGLVSGVVDVLPAGRVTGISSVPAVSLPPHNPYTLALLSSWSPLESRTGLAGLTIGQFLHRQPLRTDRYGRRLSILAAIDQAEELFCGDPSYCRALMEELQDALDADGRLRLVLSIRTERLNDLADIFDIRSAARLRLEPLTPAEATEAVCRPTEGGSRSFTPDAAEALLDDLRSLPGASVDSGSPIEPALLQVACAGIWESAPADGPFITTEFIRSAAGVSLALTSFVRRVIAETANEYGVDPEELHSWALATFDTGRTAEQGTTRTAGLANSIVRRLQDKHLLAADQTPSGTLSFRLQHDRLMEPLRGLLFSSPIRFGPDEALEAAQRALREEDLARAEHNASKILTSESQADIGQQAVAESLLGDISYLRGSLESATDHYRKAAALFEVLQNAEMAGLLLTAVGRTDTFRGHHAEAIGAMQSAVGRNPSDAAIQTALAQTLWDMGKSKSAVSVLDQILASSGDMPAALRLRSEILAALGNVSGSLRDRNLLNTGLKPRTRAARALALAAAHEFKAAAREIDMALDDAPDDGPVLLYAGQTYMVRGDDTTADDLFRRAIAAQHPPLRPQQREQAERLLSRQPGTA